MKGGMAGRDKQRAATLDRVAADPEQTIAELQRQLDERTAERDEALDQQTATAEVLGVINSSPGDLTPVFDAMLDKAMRLCEASFGLMVTVDGAAVLTVAERDMPKAFSGFLAQHLPGVGPDTFFGRAVLRRSIVHTADMRSEEAYRDGQALAVAAVDNAGVRALLMAPLVKDDVVLGVFAIFRREARAFSDKQIALLQNFAAQAVIAMENARLLTETREALDQQTATAEVLRVINSSPGDLAPVFDAILEKAHTLCGAISGSLQVYDGDQFRALACRGLAAPVVDNLRRGFRPSAGHPMRRLFDGARYVQIPDMAQVEDPGARAGFELGGMRTMLSVPLRKDGALLGQIVATRPEVRPFSDKEITLLQNFAAQAVIAIENTRLITETREALEQQTATAEVLGVINSSPGNLQPVFDLMLEKATRLCDAALGVLSTFSDDGFATHHSFCGPPEVAEFFRGRPPVRPSPGTTMDRLIQGESCVHVPDATADDVFQRGAPGRRAMVDVAGARTIIGIALRKDHALLGAITLYRQEVRPFSDKEIALLQSFAAQAVIAMENARLITETREALEQQTATAEVLQVINSSLGDLAPVFDAILEKAHTLCGAPLGSLVLFDGEELRGVATRGYPKEYETLVRRGGPPSLVPVFAQLLTGERAVQVADARVVPSDTTIARAALEIAGVRSMLFVPLQRDGSVLGYISAQRQEVRPFSDKQIALLQNFAAQAVIAMENARLITETREALDQQTATAEVLQVINSSPGDLAPVFDTMLDKAMRLCGAAFGGLMTYDGEKITAAATRGLPLELVDSYRDPWTPNPTGSYSRFLRGEQIVHTADIALGETVRSEFPRARALFEIGGARTALELALRKDDVLVGSLWFYREEVQPFTDKQIALLQNFAAQAVIAMENARLITETQEALDQQTATAEVLGVINSSPATSPRCSTRCSKRPPASAMRHLESCKHLTAMPFAASLIMASQRILANSCVNR